MTANALFLSYRRDDVPDAAGRIFDRLASTLGKEAIFKDVDTLPVGSIFGEYILDVLSDCSVLLCVIGPHWINARKEDGELRLHTEADWVRLELAAGLSSNEITVIPLLVGDARMPHRDELPEDLQNLCDCNAAQIRRDPDFHRDMDRLINAISEILSNDSRPRSLPLRKQVEKLQREKAELEAQFREAEEQRQHALADITAKERFAREEAERAAEEVAILRAEFDAQQRYYAKSATDAGANTRVSAEILEEKEQEAERLANLAEAETATKHESEIKALARLDAQQGEAIKRENMRRLAELIELSRGEVDNSTPPSVKPSIDIGIPGSKSGADVLAEKEAEDARAQQAAARLLHQQRSNELKRTSEPNFAPGEVFQPRRVNKRRARAIASKLSSLEPGGDMRLAMHHAIQIEQQQGIRVPIMLDETENAPRSRVQRWCVEEGEIVEKGAIIAYVSVEESITTIEAHETGMLIRRLVEENGYVPSSGVIGYLQPA